MIEFCRHWGSWENKLSVHFVNAPLLIVLLNNQHFQLLWLFLYLSLLKEVGKILNRHYETLWCWCNIVDFQYSLLFLWPSPQSMHLVIFTVQLFAVQFSTVATLFYSNIHALIYALRWGEMTQGYISRVKVCLSFAQWGKLLPLKLLRGFFYSLFSEARNAILNFRCNIGMTNVRIIRWITIFSQNAF